MSSSSSSSSSSFLQTSPLPDRSHDHASLLRRIKSCGQHKDLQKGRQIHVHLLLLQPHLLSSSSSSASSDDGDDDDDDGDAAAAAAAAYIRNALITMYARCGAFPEALKLFQERPAQHGGDVVSWNALISGYVQQGLPGEALACFRRMRQHGGAPPSSVTFVCVLKACGLARDLALGEAICGEVRARFCLERDVVLATAAMDMYAKCGRLDMAQQVFDSMQVRDVVCWTALIAGYASHGLGAEALRRFEQMREEDGIAPNVVTFISILKACSCSGGGGGGEGALRVGEAIHGEAAREGLMEKSLALGTAVVDMYAKCGMLEKAREAFRKLPCRDAVAWNAMLAAYAQHGLHGEALQAWREMQEEEGIRPTAATFVCVLRSCGNLGSIGAGEALHRRARNLGLIPGNLALGNTLLGMYAKCGDSAKARDVFDRLAAKDVVSWSVLMAGYAQLGQARMVLDVFDGMIRAGTLPDAVCFVALLTVCSHGGLVEEGQRVLEDMGGVYALAPAAEHYTCMVDLFGRAARFDGAARMIEQAAPSTPPRHRIPLWLALLSCCRERGNVELGEWAFERLLELDEACAAMYVCMGNVYGGASRMPHEAKAMEAPNVERKKKKKKKMMMLKKKEMPRVLCPIRTCA